MPSPPPLPQPAVRVGLARRLGRRLKRVYLEVDPRGLAVFRVALGALLCFDVLRRFPNVDVFYANTGWLPNHAALYRPASAHLFSIYHAASTPGEVTCLLLVHLAFALCLMVGWRTRLMQVLCLIFTTSLNSRNVALESGGWVMVNLITLWSVFLPLGRRFSVDAVLAALRARALPASDAHALVSTDNDEGGAGGDVVSDDALRRSFVSDTDDIGGARSEAAGDAGEAAGGRLVSETDNAGGAGDADAARGSSVSDADDTGGAANEATEAPEPRWPIGVLPAPSRLPVRSLAVLAILLQWAVVYYFNAVHKVGPSWQSGDAIYYFIHQERLTHGLGSWLREVLPLAALRFMTHAALVIEYAIPALLLLPIGSRYARLLAWALGVGLHLGIGAFAALGPFVWVMMVPYPLFVAASSWDRVSAFIAARRPQVTVRVPDSPGGASLGRLFLALDSLCRCQVSVDPSPAATISARLLSEGDSAPWRTGGQALYLISAGWPVPRAPLRSLCLPGVRGLIAWLLRQLAAGGQLERAAARPAPAPGGLRRVSGWAAQALIGLMMVAAASQVLVENRAVPKRLKPEHRPAWLMALIEYPRLFQGWSMFAPDPPREDGRMIVDGRTADGRKLDPFTGQAPHFSAHRPPGVPNDSDWSAFHMRVPEARYAPNYPHLRQLLLRYHELCGRPEERLVAFEVWYGSQTIPPPGEPAPPPRYRLLFRHGTVSDPGVPREHVGRGDTQAKPPRRVVKPATAP